MPEGEEDAPATEETQVTVPTGDTADNITGGRAATDTECGPYQTGQGGEGRQDGNIRGAATSAATDR